MEREGKCCFCGKQYTNYGNDIRPLVNARGSRCCDDCNVDIVITNRLKFWNCEYYYVIYCDNVKSYLASIDSVNGYSYTNRFEDAAKFGTEAYAIQFLLTHNKQDIWYTKRIGIREDN